MSGMRRGIPLYSFQFSDMEWANKWFDELSLDRQEEYLDDLNELYDEDAVNDYIIHHCLLEFIDECSTGDVFMWLVSLDDNSEQLHFILKDQERLDEYLYLREIRKLKTHFGEPLMEIQARRVIDVASELRRIYPHLFD